MWLWCTNCGTPFVMHVDDADCQSAAHDAVVCFADHTMLQECRTMADKASARQTSRVQTY